MTELDLKLALRRQVVQAGKFKRLRVLHIFSGEGGIWRQFEGDLKLDAYIPCPVNGRGPEADQAGRPPLWVEAIAAEHLNVVDIDTAGEPWEIWASAARRLEGPAAVFLAQGTIGAKSLSEFSKQSLGIPATWEIPVKAPVALSVARYFLAAAFERLQTERIWQLELPKSVCYGALVQLGAAEAR
jgi:hypothetical protein